MIRLLVGSPDFPLLLDCYIARHLQKPLCMMQAWEQTPSLAACSQPKPSLGARKTEPRCLERQKCPRCGAQKKTGGAEVYRSTRAKHQSNGCHVESKREVVAYIVSLSWLPVLQPLVESIPDSRKTTQGLGFKSHVERKVIVFNCSSIWCGYSPFRVAWSSEIGRAQ